MAMSILPIFLTLKWNISRTIWHIEIGDDSLFCIFHALPFELNFFSTGGSLKTLTELLKTEKQNSASADEYTILNKLKKLYARFL